MRYLYVVLFFIPTLLFAQEALPELAEVPAFLKNASGPIELYILKFMSEYPVIFKFVTITGSLRYLFKPLNQFIWFVVNQTKSLDDEVKYLEVRKSKAFSIFAFFLDLFASVKAKNPKE